MNTTRNKETPPTAGAAKQYLRGKAMAALLGVSQRTLVRWANEGRVSRYKVSARVALYDPVEIDQLIQGARTAA